MCVCVRARLHACTIYSQYSKHVIVLIVRFSSNVWNFSGNPVNFTCNYGCKVDVCSTGFVSVAAKDGVSTPNCKFASVSVYVSLCIYLFLWTGVWVDFGEGGDPVQLTPIGI